MDFYPFRFTGRIVHHNLGTYRYTVIFLDPGLVEQLPFDQHPRLRVSGEIEALPFEGAWQPSRGKWYLMLNQALLHDGELEVGDDVNVCFRVEDQNAIDLPPELKQMLESHADLAGAFAALTVGRRRGLCHHVNSAKTSPTRQRRLREVETALRHPSRSGPLKRLLGVRA